MPYLPLPYLTPQVPSGRPELDLRSPEPTGGMQVPIRRLDENMREPLITV